MDSPANRATEFVNKLSLGYNLDLRVPDLKLSPRKRTEAQTTEAEAVAEHIHRRIRQLASQCPVVLAKIEQQFNVEARAICTNWVRKPRAAPDLLPVTLARPKASSAEERRQLRDCLLAVINPYLRDHGNRGRAQNRQGGQPRYRKRPSDEALQEPDGAPARPNGSSIKKARSPLDQVPVRITSALSNGSNERVAMPANRSFGFRDNLSIHPPRYHSFNGLPPQPPHTLDHSQAARPPSRAPTTGTHSFSCRVINPESANTSMTTNPSAIFSFPPPDDSDSSQTTIPNDDRAEYKNAHLAADVAFYRPETPPHPGLAEPAIDLNNGATLGIPPSTFTSSEEVAMIALDPTTPEKRGFEITSPSENLKNLNLPDAPPGSLEWNGASPCSGATIAIRQRDPISSAPSIPATESTDWSVGVDHQLPIYGKPPLPEEPSARLRPSSLEYRLRDSWPKLPKSLTNAPLPVAWEVTRAALHCGVGLDDLCMKYDLSWREPSQFRKMLATHNSFTGKTLPEKCCDGAWEAAFSDFRQGGQGVTLAIDASYNDEKDGPLYKFCPQPLKLEPSYRLARRFGADRFLEVIIPSPTGNDNPRGLNVDELIDLLSQSDHILLGRIWRSFFTKPDKKVEKLELFTGTDTKTVQQQRLYLFAIDGNYFMPSMASTIPPTEEATSMDRGTKMTIAELLEWAISLSLNSLQPTLKLFSRISLSLSKSTPTVVLEKHQIRDHSDDLRSPAGQVMNDGIGRMSPRLAKLITACLPRDDQETRSGFQGRIGPYKGFWVIDSVDDGEIWIDGYPSQRKWNCDLEDTDHRTFEVQNTARRLTPGALNEQFIPVLEDRATDRSSMREAISLPLVETVSEQLEEHTRAAKNSMTLYGLAHQNASGARAEKIAIRQTPFLGALPKSDEDAIRCLIDAGFDPRLKFIQELVEKLGKQRFKGSKEKVKIVVRKSTYAFMVADFWGVLEEGEVHLGFSRNSECDTRAPDGISRNELHGHDVLVARAPAHFPSDVQKVKAVFKPELRHLQDVIVFSTKGNVPLADILSGGDYDGDKAWVCWDENIVKNFKNAPVPEMPDLFARGYITKDKRTFEDTLQSGYGNNPDAAVSRFLKDSFAFNLQPQLLGICTSYKEKVCYHLGSVNNEKAIILSTLVSHLVDQPKQGIIFTDKEFRRLKSDLIKMSFDNGEEPAYKKERYSGRGPPKHILDWLKFTVIMPLTDKELGKFLRDISGGKQAEHWDPDLEYYWKDLDELAKGSESYTDLRKVLMGDLEEVFDRWKKCDLPYQTKVEAVYQMWCDIRPSKRALKKTPLRHKLIGPQGDPDSISYWGKLKASVAYKRFYNSPGFVWRMAGAHLATIKVEMHSAATGNFAVPVVPEMWVAHQLNKKMVAALTAKDEDPESVAGHLSGDDEVDDV